MRKTIISLAIITGSLFAEDQVKTLKISAVETLTPIASTENTLKVVPSCLTYIEPLTDYPKFIQCNDKNLEDISYLTGIKEAKSIFISMNKISDLTPFKDLKSVTYQLYLGKNNISSLAPLSNLESVLAFDISNNPNIEDLSPLNNLTINNTGILYTDDREYKVKLNHSSPICSSVRDSKIVFQGKYEFICNPLSSTLN